MAGGMLPQQVFPVYLGNGEKFYSKLIFSCRLILGASVHEKMFQIGATVLALKLDKGRVLGVAIPPIEEKLTYFSNHEDDIQSSQNLLWSKKILSRYISAKKFHDNAVKGNITVTSSNFSQNTGTIRILTILW